MIINLKHNGQCEITFTKEDKEEYEKIMNHKEIKILKSLNIEVEAEPNINQKQLKKLNEEIHKEWQKFTK